MLRDNWRVFMTMKRIFRGLKKEGWVESVRRKAPVDKKGDALPLYTYAAIYFVDSKLKNNMDVFEYGSGYSTLWYASRVGNVVAVENNAIWSKRVLNLVEKNGFTNVELLTVKNTRDEYINSINTTGRKYDLISIDGRNRLSCINVALKHLNSDGIVLFDDTQRVKYQSALSIFKDAGFKRLDFYGLRPLESDMQMTSIYYRDDNVFAI